MTLLRQYRLKFKDEKQHVYNKSIINSYIHIANPQNVSYNGDSQKTLKLKGGLQ